MGNARHPHFKSETMKTSFGDVVLDSKGFASSAKATEEQILGLPGFLDNRDFPLPGVKEDKPEEVELIVASLLKDPTNLNSQAKLDMDKLNNALLAAGLQRVSGSVRDALVAKVTG